MTAPEKVNTQMRRRPMFSARTLFFFSAVLPRNRLPRKNGMLYAMHGSIRRAMKSSPLRCRNGRSTSRRSFESGERRCAVFVFEPHQSGA
jgi:hypothetical protein